MKIIKKFIAPAALSLLLALGLAIFVPGFVNSAIEPKNNMTLSYEAKGNRNGTYDIAITAQQEKSELAAQINNPTLNPKGLLDLYANAQAEGNPLMYSNDGGATFHPITMTLRQKNGVIYLEVKTNGETFNYDWSQQVPITIDVTPSTLYHQQTYGTNSKLTINFKSDFDLDGLTPIFVNNADSATAQLTESDDHWVLTVTNYNYSAHAADGSSPAPLSVSISGVKLKNTYTEAKDIDTIDTDTSALTATGNKINFPQDQVPVGPYTYKLIYKTNKCEGEEVTESANDAETSHTFTINGAPYVRENYTLAGWSETPEEDETKPEYKTGDTITVEATDLAGLEFSKTLYPIWTENTVTITYTASTGGEVNVAEEIVPIVTGQPEGSIATPEKGYKFVNWTDEEGVVVSTDPHFIPTENREATYTANFEKEEITPENSVDVLKPTAQPTAQPTAPSTGSNSVATDSVNASVFSSILGLFIFGLILAAIARIKR